MHIWLVDQSKGNDCHWLAKGIPTIRGAVTRARKALKDPYYADILQHGFIAIMGVPNSRKITGNSWLNLQLSVENFTQRGIEKTCQYLIEKGKETTK